MTNIDVIFLAGEHGRPSGPARVKIPVGIEKGMDVKLNGEINEEKEVEFFGYLVPPDDKESELFVIVPELNKRDELESSFSVEPVESIGVSESKSNVAVEMTKVSDNQIKIEINGKEFTNLYWNNLDVFNRPCLYPLLAPCGEGVTRNFPIKKVDGDTNDHPHHTSCWTAWGETNGADNWAFGKKKARQVVKNIEFETNSVYGKINLDIDWVTKKGKSQLKEERQIWIYNMKDDKIIDFEIKLTPTDDGDVEFGDTKEGGFLSIRVATSMDGTKGGKIENTLGAITEKETWGKRAQWCDYSGVVNGKNVGVTIFDNSNNLNFPTYWHVRDYGLMSANPFGISYFIDKSRNGSFTLKKGKELVFKYRLVVHNGDAIDAKIRERYLNYEAPWETPVFKS